MWGGRGGGRKEGGRERGRVTLAVTTFSLRTNGISPPFLLLLLPRRSLHSLGLQKHQSHVWHGHCANCEYSSGYFFAPLAPPRA